MQRKLSSSWKGGPAVRRVASRQLADPSQDWTRLPNPLVRHASAPACHLLRRFLVVVTSLGAQQSVDPPRRPFLFKDARGELAAARARGDSGVTVVVASMPGANAKAAALAKRLGGTVRYRDDDVDYLRVRLPVDSVDRLVGDPIIHSVDVSISGMSRAFGRASEQVPGDASTIGESRTLDGSPSTLPFAPWTAARWGWGAPRDTTKQSWPPALPETPLTNRYDPLTRHGGDRVAARESDVRWTRRWDRHHRPEPRRPAPGAAGRDDARRQADAQDRRAT